MRSSFVLSVACVCVATILSLSPSSLFAQKCLYPGFKVELVYEVPDIEHPSVVACDDEGNLFVGEDPMDMRGPTTKHIDRVILIRWDKATGKPIKTVFCDNLAAVFGLIWHDGALYVMHAPLYSVYRDTNGDGVADEHKELASGFGPPAGVYGFNDHIVTGTRLGMDGLVYVSVGDKGVPKATGADGSTCTLEGGGVIRMRLDGTQLEVVSSGTRNHLDVAMDSLDNIFTYDNTDDGLGWWTRFTHHMPTGYYGYPYDYLKHGERHLPRISEHGGGSPVGAACYREAAWPAKYKDAAFHCEWGKGKVQVFFTKRVGATFEATMEDFLVKEGAGEFRPQDLNFSPDGKHMYVADWNYGGWTNPKLAGRLYRVSYVGTDVPAEPARTTNQDGLDAQIKSLAHPAHAERMRAQWQLAKMGQPAADAVAKVLAQADADKYARIHAIWTQNALIDAVEKYDPSFRWGLALQTANNADVRAQAARALGYRKFKSGRTALIRALQDKDASVRMHAAIALGRIGDASAADALYDTLGDKDRFVQFAVIQALRAINHWTAASKYTMSPDAEVRKAALVALTGQYDEAAVKVLIETIKLGPDAETKAYAVSCLAEVHAKADPYEKGWWGTQPARGKPARPKKHEWAGTSAVRAALREALQQPTVEVRRAALTALTDIKDPEVMPTVTKIALDTSADAGFRQDALEALLAVKAPTAATTLAAIAADDKAPATLVVYVLDKLTALKASEAAAVIEKRLNATDTAIRAKAIEAYGALKGGDAAPVLVAAIKDGPAEIRLAAIRAVGAGRVRDAIPAVIDAAAIVEHRQAATDVLCAIPDARALGLYLLGLESKDVNTRNACRAALTQVRAEIGDDIIARHKANELSPAMRRELQSVFTAASPIGHWHIVGGWSDEKGPPKLDFTQAPDFKQPIKIGDREVRWKDITTKDPAGRVSPGQYVQPSEHVWSVAYHAIDAEGDGDVQFLLGSDDQAILYVNGEKVFEFLGNRGWEAGTNKGRLPLKQGRNHIYFLCGNTSGPYDFSLAMQVKTPRYAFLFENVPAQLDTTAYRDYALKQAGNAERGKKLFSDEKGVACIKCHAVAGQGAKVGPDLVGVGGKYPREELIRSVLEPSARVAQGYLVTTLSLDDGRQLAGIIKSETEAEVELVDATGKTHKLAKESIESRRASNLSLMPNGLKDGMSLDDLADLVAFLESLKEAK